MAITKIGLEEVDKALLEAKKGLALAENQLKKAQRKVVRLEKCSKCSHENLENIDTHIYAQAQCNDCGFIWTD